MTITGRSMPSEIETSETSKIALTMRLFPPRIPAHSFQLLQQEKPAIQSTCVLPCTQTIPCQSPSVSSTELNRYYTQKGAAITYLLFSDCSKNTIKLKMCWLLDFTAASLHTDPDNVFYSIKNNFLYSYLVASSYNPKPDVGMLTISDLIKASLWFLSPFTCFQTFTKNRCLATAGFALITSWTNKTKNLIHVKSWNLNPCKKHCVLSKILLFTIQKIEFPFLVTPPCAAGAKSSRINYFRHVGVRAHWPSGTQPNEDGKPSSTLIQRT